MLNRKVRSVAGALFYILCFNVSIFSGEGSIKIINTKPSFYAALTFDDGPHEGYTKKLLDVLKKHNVKATFFVVGKQVSKFPAYLKDIHNSGHEIANHTYSHPQLTKIDENTLVRELDYTRYLVKSLTGQECLYFRPPGGHYNLNVIQTSFKAGYEMILWSVFPQDHKDISAHDISQKITSDIYDGGVVLLHSGRPATLEALPEIITKLKQRGYEFVTVSDLIRRDRNTPNLYTFYKSYGSRSEFN